MLQNAIVEKQQKIFMPLLKYRKLPRILVVEDNFVINKLYQEILEKQFNCIVEFAINGKEALRVYGKDFDLILLDCELPDISGLEVCKRIRNCERANNKHPIPIIMVSALVKEELEPLCKQVGVNELLNKPIINIDAWISRLNYWLGKNKI